jgi:hypothetical protein
MRKREINELVAFGTWGLLFTGFAFLLVKAIDADDQSVVYDSNGRVLENLKYKNAGGNPRASNVKGSGTFNYQRFIQAQYEGDKIGIKIKGIECKMSTNVFLYKSLGLLPPTLSRKEFERIYTYLFNSQNSRLKIPSTYNMALRGFEAADITDKSMIKKAGEAFPQINFSSDKKTFLSFAKLFQNTEYAKQTGMNNVNLEIKQYENKKQAINDILKGHTVYFSVTNQAGYAKHYLLACDIEIIKIQQKNNTSIDYVAFKNIDDPYDDNRRTEIEALLDYKDKKDTIGKMKDFWTIKVA